MTYVLDASAIVAYLRQEPGHERFAALVADPANGLMVHAINLGEVYYHFLKFDGPKVAEQSRRMTLAVADERRQIGRAFMAKVVAGKIRLGRSYGGAFALALTERVKSPLVTTDHGSFEPIEHAGSARFHWLR